MPRRSFYKASIVVLALVLAGTAMPSGAARTRTRTVTLAPGVTYTKIRDPKGPWSIRVVGIELAAASSIEPALATRKLPGFERTSSIARRYGAVAAINGDYARESGRPVMLFAQDGELAQTALTWGVNFAVNQSETATFIKHQEPFVWLQDPAGFEHEIETMNAGWPSTQTLAGFSWLAGAVEPPPYNACSARLYPTLGPRLASTQIGVEQPHVVDEVACRYKRMWPRGGRVVATPLKGARRLEVASLVPGDDVELGWSLTWPEVFDTIGGAPTLVRNGEVFVGRSEGSFFNRHPRTGVGTTADGRVLFVTVDGRQPGYSVGMTPLRFAKLFVKLGAEFALNLDGGGSTTMVVGDEVVNRPSDGSERPVSSALVLLPGPDPTPTTTPGPLPTVSPTPTASTSATPTTSATPSPEPTSLDRTTATYSPSTLWLRIARDPASTGGLADWYRREGRPLYGSLRRAAFLFSRLR